MTLDPQLAGKLVYIFGITNILSLLLVFFSCRCMSGRLTKGLFQYTWYKKFYAKHTLYWWIFFVSVLLHTSLAFWLFGWPF